jgi:phage/conjugal plasmid C-4 type zinc finger TraR family protein
MGDDIERAQKFDQVYLAQALAAHYRNRIKGVSSTHCEDCRTPIPKQRREAAPGCTRCIKCQSAFENDPHWRNT